MSRLGFPELRKEQPSALRVSAHLYNTIDDYVAVAPRFAGVLADPSLRPPSECPGG